MACLFFPVFSGKAQVDLPRLLLDETLRIPLGKSSFQAIWCIPVEFWQQTWPEGLGEKEQLFRQQTLLRLRDYVLIAAVPTVNAQFSLENLKLTIKGSGTIPRVPFLSLNEDLQVFLDRIRPMVANVLEVPPDKVSLLLFVIPELHMQKSGTSYEAIVRYLEESFEWNYPPTAVLTPGQCPVDGKVLSPGWKFCPWHGNALSPVSNQGVGQ